MSLQTLARTVLNSPIRRPLFDAANHVLMQQRLRRPLFSLIDLWLSRSARPRRRASGFTPRIQLERSLVARAILHTVERLMTSGQISPRVMRVISERWAKAWCLTTRTGASCQRFRAEHGCDPPWFLTLSPGSACNLSCPGCYANGGSTAANLPWPVLERVMAEARELWGVPLFVFSGGEPLLYRSCGHGVLDAAEQHPDCLFLMFTNGTMITREVARRMERIANLTPAISVEGMEESTDRRRGRGQFARTLEAISLLRESGVPFGFSATLTRMNLTEILSDRFLDFFFLELGAFYGFLFQYMPIGRGACLDWMPTPGQRVDSWEAVWHAIESKGIFLFDFWNHGPMVGGCMSAGRQGGHLYIDWAGRVMPCVFAPYSAANIQEVYASGGTLEDVWKAPFFRAIRDWQREYGYDGGPLPKEQGNWMRPCPVRDHYAHFHRLVEEHLPEPEDENARLSLRDEAYAQGMAAYGEELQQLTDTMWNKIYVNP